MTRRRFLVVVAGAAAAAGVVFLGSRLVQPPPPPQISPGLQKLAYRLLNGGVVDPRDGESSIGFDSNNPNPNLRLLRGAFVGGCGFQPVAYDLIDENFLAGNGLNAFYPSESGTIISNVK